MKEYYDYHLTTKEMAKEIWKIVKNIPKTLYIGILVRRIVKLYMLEETATLKGNVKNIET